MLPMSTCFLLSPFPTAPLLDRDHPDCIKIVLCIACIQFVTVVMSFSNVIAEILLVSSYFFVFRKRPGPHIEILPVTLILRAINGQFLIL